MSRFSSYFGAIVLASFFALMAAPANAAVIVYSLSATLDDGDVLSGSFRFDSDTGDFTNIEINATGGTLRPGARVYDTVLANGGPIPRTFIFGASSDGPDFSSDPSLFGASSEFGNIGIIDVFNFNRANCVDSICDSIETNEALPTDLLVSGVVLDDASPVSAPSALSMLIIGFLGLSWTRRRNRAIAA